MSYTKFSSGVRWSLFGGIFYESTKVIHQVLLLSTLSMPTYGKMGTIFSIIYLAMNLLNAGAISTITPFLATFKRSKTIFAKIFGGYLLFQTWLLLTGGVILFALSNKLFLNTEITTYIPIAIMISEGLRTLLRAFLHTIFLHKRVVVIESVLNIAYLAMVWIPYINGQNMTLDLVFKPYLLTSVIALIIFVIHTIQFYTTLPKKHISLERGIFRRIAKARFFNGLTRLTKHIFTGNFLVPLFAHRFGLAEAGIFKFASYISDSIKAILNTTIGFTSGALLASLKESSITEKRKAFHIISEKLNKVIYFLLIFLAINTKTLLNINNAIYDVYTVMIFASFFLFAALLEKLFLAYDQFYIVEELSDKLLGFQILELILFYIVTTSHFSPTVTLLSLLLVRIFTFCIIATSSAFRWNIKPNFKVEWKFVTYSFIVSLILHLILR